MNKIIVRSIRLYEAKAYEKLLNEYATKGYRLDYSYGSLNIFVESDEPVYYQVVKNPRKNKEKYIEFCEEFDIKRVNTIAFGCLHVFESKRPYQVSLDEQIDHTVFASLQWIHLFKMILFYAFIITAVSLGSSFDRTFYPKVSLYASELYLIKRIFSFIYLGYMTYDFVKTLYYTVNKKEVDSFMFASSLRAIVFIVTFCLMVFILGVDNKPILMINALLILIAVIVAYFSKRKGFREVFISVPLFVALNVYISLNSRITTSYLVHLAENSRDLTPQQTSVLGTEYQGNPLQFGTVESSALEYGRMTYNETEDGEKTQQTLYVYYRVKEGILSHKIKKEIESYYSTYKVLDDEGILVDRTPQMIQNQDEYIVFLKPIDNQDLKKMERLFKTNP